MTLLSLLVFLIPSITGILLVHLFWSERTGKALLFKTAIGVGLGLGVNSMIYFLVLLAAPTFHNMWVISGGLLLVVVVVTVIREYKKNRMAIKFPQVSHLQWVFLGLGVIAFILSGLTFLNLTEARPQGAYDAWSIWNRAARFIYRDPENWQATLSPDLYWGTHPDYPLLIPLNVAWGWSMIGEETQRTPMIQSAVFVAVSLLLMFSAIRLTRTLGQASLASLALLGTPIFISTGYGQIADSPLAYFILAACVLIYMYFKLDQPKFLILAGFMAGLGAWTKNEGLLFLGVSLPALFLAGGRREFFRLLGLYTLGLALPLAVVLFFKIALAPPNDLFAPGGSNNGILAKIMDLSRYWVIAKATVTTFLTYPGWPLSIFIQIAVYAFIMRTDRSKVSPQGTRAVVTAILLQLLGYCAIYVVTPHDLVWHLNSALQRLIFHVFPASVFLIFTSTIDPEQVLQDTHKGRALAD